MAICKNTKEIFKKKVPKKKFLFLFHSFFCEHLQEIHVDVDKNIVKKEKINRRKKKFKRKNKLFYTKGITLRGSNTDRVMNVIISVSFAFKSHNLCYLSLYVIR